MLDSEQQIDLRILKGDECTPEEIPCKIEYRTNNGSACVFAAAKKVQDVEKIEFWEMEDGTWGGKCYADEAKSEATFSQQQAYEIFLRGGINIEMLKADSVRVQQQIMKEKEVEKQAQSRKETDVIW